MLAPDVFSKSSQLEGEQIQRTKGKETRGAREEEGGHVQVAQPSFCSDFTSLGFFPFPFHPLLIILLPHFMFPHSSLSFHAVQSPSL